MNYQYKYRKYKTKYQQLRNKKIMSGGGNLEVGKVYQTTDGTVKINKVLLYYDVDYVDRNKQIPHVTMSEEELLNIIQPGSLQTPVPARPARILPPPPSTTRILPPVPQPQQPQQLQPPSGFKFKIRDDVIIGEDIFYRGSGGSVGKITGVRFDRPPGTPVENIRISYTVEIPDKDNPGKQKEVSIDEKYLYRLGTINVPRFKVGQTIKGQSLPIKNIRYIPHLQTWVYSMTDMNERDISILETKIPL